MPPPILMCCAVVYHSKLWINAPKYNASDSFESCCCICFLCSVSYSLYMCTSHNVQKILYFIHILELLRRSLCRLQLFALFLPLVMVVLEMH